MSDSFDPVDFAFYLRSRWKTAAICCTTAIVLAASAGILLPKRYTAKSTLIVEPPSGTDPRATLAVSPVYLESLKTYENFATSDTLFARALEELDLRRRYQTSSIESLKRRVLTVTKPPSTRIIEVEATLGDPVGAKRLAQFIAEQTVGLSRSMARHASDDVVHEAEKNVVAAETRLASSLKAAPGNGVNTVEELTADITNASDLRYDIQRDLARAEADLADSTSKANTNAEQIAAARARIADLRAQEDKLAVASSQKSETLARVRPISDSMEAEQRLARADLEAARTKLAEARYSAVYGAERLEVLDPGVVPESPSYPNTPLMMVVALTVSLVGSLAYLAAAFGYNRAMSTRAERVYSMR
jgi:capsule polysaccharide export protein KpsE/RkpR